VSHAKFAVFFFFLIIIFFFVFFFSPYSSSSFSVGTANPMRSFASLLDFS
jgi:hypothetical protein